MISRKHKAKDVVVPDYLDRLAPGSDDQIWRDIELSFSEAYDLVHVLEFETKEDAAKFDWRPSLGPLAPFNSTLDVNDLKELQSLAAEMHPSIGRALESRTLSPAFLAQWGSYEFVAGRLATAYYATRSDESRRQPKLSKEKQRRWVAIQLSALVVGEGKTRKDANCIVFGRVRTILTEEAFNGEFNVDWFKALLLWTKGTPQSLAPAYLGDNGNLTKGDLRRYIGAPRAGIPPIPEGEPPV